MNNTVLEYGKAGENTKDRHLHLFVRKRFPVCNGQLLMDTVLLPFKECSGWNSEKAPLRAKSSNDGPERTVTADFLVGTMATNSRRKTKFK